MSRLLTLLGAPPPECNLTQADKLEFGVHWFYGEQFLLTMDEKYQFVEMLSWIMLEGLTFK